MEDTKLAAAIARKDDEAARRLVDEHFDGIYRFLKQLCRSSEEAQDLAQQTLIRVVRNAGRYDGRAPLRSWIYAIAYREFGRWRRRRLWLPLSTQIESEDNVAARVTDGALLAEALMKLRTEHRAVFLMHYVEGFSIEEIAVVQRTKPGTVKSRLHFARRYLKSMLEQEEFYVAEPT